MVNKYNVIFINVFDMCAGVDKYKIIFILAKKQIPGFLVREVLWEELLWIDCPSVRTTMILRIPVAAQGDASLGFQHMEIPKNVAGGLLHIFNHFVGCRCIPSQLLSHGDESTNQSAVDFLAGVLSATTFTVLLAKGENQV
jgi:hypothetical protein